MLESMQSMCCSVCTVAIEDMLAKVGGVMGVIGGVTA